MQDLGVRLTHMCSHVTLGTYTRGGNPDCIHKDTRIMRDSLLDGLKNEYGFEVEVRDTVEVRETLKKAKYQKQVVAIAWN